MVQCYLAEVANILLVAGGLHGSPGVIGQLVSNVVEVELAVLLAVLGDVAYSRDNVSSVIHRLVVWTLTLGLAVAADVRRALRALGSRVALLLADAASALEDTGLGAVSLGVTVTS